MKKNTVKPEANKISTVKAEQKVKAVKPAAKKEAPKTYSLVIEGLSKTQAEALLKFFQKEAKCSIQ